MPLVIADRVKETSVTTGTGMVTLGGAAVGFQTFSSALATGSTCYYTIQAVDASGNPSGQWETGVGVYTTAGNTLSRSVQTSSSANALVPFSGNLQVFLTVTSAQMATLAPAATPTFTGSVTLSTASAGIEIGSLSGANTPYIDFHSSGNANDYDARIIVSGGSANGSGSLQIIAAGGVSLPVGSSAPGILGSVSNTVTAAGTTQATATALVSDVNVVTTSTASTGLGVALPGATSGKYAVIVNLSANAIKVYPATGHQFDGLGVNAAISLPINGFLEIYASSGTQWYSTTNAIINTSALIGTVSVASGGTGAATLTGLLKGNGASAFTAAAAADITTAGGAVLGANTFTGTQAHGNNTITGVKLLTFSSEFDNGLSGTVITVSLANGAKQKLVLNAATPAITVNTATAAVGQYQIRIVQSSSGGSVPSFTGLVSTRWLGSASAPALNTAVNGESILTMYFDGTNITQSLSKVGAV